MAFGFSLPQHDRTVVLWTSVASAAVSALVTYAVVVKRLRSAAQKEKLDTQSRTIYESEDSARQYMEFHFTPSKESFCRSLKTIDESFDFPLRVARKFEQFKPAKCGRGLDLGCATGASVFEMSKTFNEVVGVDLSTAFIKCANDLKDGKMMDYYAPDQGKTTVPRAATIPAGANASRCTFVVGDAQDVDAALGKFDAVLAANLLCRVPEPRTLLASFAKVLVSGGVLVLVSPYSWWEGATPSHTWIGGRPNEPRSEEQVKAILSENFVLLDEKDEPFLIRDHHRRFQLGFSHCTVWRRK